MHEQIFSRDTLGHYYSTFESQYFPQLNEKLEIVTDWIVELRSGKLNSLKEEEVKSRFVTEIFGDVLEFNCGNSTQWSLREEAKTKTDGTKPDAALGYFSMEKSQDDVRAIIEIKDANTELDAKQKRPGSKTAIDQAFEYAPKMGGKCKWVIVSNFKEIRIYPSADRSRYQCYKLEDLENFETLREFLFLFQRSRFISKSKKSRTDRYFEFALATTSSISTQDHILDVLYKSLKRFDGFGFVDPNYLAALYPFNILGDHVWYYDSGTLFTINPAIYEMMHEIEIVDGKITMTDIYREKLEATVLDYQNKIEWVLKFLNNSNVDRIDAIKNYKGVEASRGKTIGFSIYHSFRFNDEQGITKDIKLKTPDFCDCISCNFRNFDFKKAFEKLKASSGDFYSYSSEIAYGHYLAANYKEAFNIYKFLDRYKYKEDKGIAYFLTKLNLKSLHNLIKYNYYLMDKDVVMKTIKSVDIDAIIHDELDFEIDNDVRQYLIQVKEAKLVSQIKQKVKKSNQSIEKLKQLYDNNGEQTGGTNLAQEIAEHYFEIYLHDNRNFIIHDVFSEYGEMVKEVFQGLVKNYRTAKVGMRSFNDFFIREAIIYVNSDELTTLLRDSKPLKIDEEGLQKLIQQFETYLKSFYTDSPMAFDPIPNDLMTEFLLNRNLEKKLRQIFTNFFIILCNSELPNNALLAIEKALLNFLRTEKFLFWFNVRPLTKFIEIKGNLLSEETLHSILKIAISEDKSNNNKYEKLVDSCCRAINKFYPESKISNPALVSKAIANCQSISNGFTNFRYYLFLLKILDESGVQQLTNAIDESFDKDFNTMVYEDLLRNKLYHYQYKDYFNQYVTLISKYSGGGITFSDNEVEYSNGILLNAALIFNALGIKLTTEQKQLFIGLTQFDQWMLDPTGFDYELFELVWLKAVIYHKNFMKILSPIKSIQFALERKLSEDFIQEYSDVYTKYFLAQNNILTTASVKANTDVRA